MNNPIEFTQQTINNINNPVFIAAGRLGYEHHLVNYLLSVPAANPAPFGMSDCETIDEVKNKLSCSIYASIGKKLEPYLVVCPYMDRIISPLIEKLMKDYPSLKINVIVTHDVRVKGKIFQLINYQDIVRPVPMLIVVGYLSFPIETITPKLCELSI